MGINTLINNVVAPHGALPGTTTTANFYRIGSALTLVDLPGYGFYNPAQVSELEKEAAEAVLRQYLKLTGRHGMRSRNIARVIVCVDSRGIHKSDIRHFEFLEKVDQKFCVVAMKTDTFRPIELCKRVQHMRAQLAHYNHCTELMMARSMRLSGISPLQSLIGQFGGSKEKRSDVGIDEIADIV